MATNPSNANSRISVPENDGRETAPPRTEEREALQALLAFSTLHDQICRRRADDARRYAAGLGASENPWEYHQFVLDEVLQLVAERAQTITGADAVAIALAEGEAIVCRASVGAMAPDRGMRIDPKGGFSGACLLSGRIIRCDDAETDPRVDPNACRRLGVRSMVAVPLMGQENPVGLLEAFSAEPFGFSDNHVRSLNLLGDLILAALKPEDEERIVRAAKAAAADWEAQDLEKLSHAVSNEPVAAPLTAPEPGISVPETEGTPLEFSKEDLAPPLYETRGSGWRVLQILVGLALAVALAVAGGLWFHRRSGQRPSATEGLKSSSVSKPVVKPARGAADRPAAGPELQTSAVPSQTGGHAEAPAEVNGIRYWTQNGISTVTIDVPAEVQYETHRLENPDRIYFDLHDMTLAGSLTPKTISVAEGPLLKIRVGQPEPGTTRVVLETKGTPNFSVRMEENPYRLVIEMRAPEVAPVSPKPVVEPAKPMESGTKMAAPATVAAPATSRGESHVRTQPPALKVVIDAGHGGWDLGTVGRHGLLEKDLVLDVAQRLGSDLQKRYGYDVVFTRKDDTYLSLEQRAELANEAEADLFVSVHANYSDSASARGVETYYSSFFSPPEAREYEFGENPEAKPVTRARLSGMELKGKVDGSRTLAGDIQRALYGTLSSGSPGIRNRGVREASYVVLTGTEMPSVLTEISFVSSPEDEARLENPTYRQEIADAVSRGIAQYASSTRRVKIASSKLSSR